jgi:hypothetical protein
MLELLVKDKNGNEVVKHCDALAYELLNKMNQRITIREVFNSEESRTVAILLQVNDKWYVDVLFRGVYEF